MNSNVDQLDNIETIGHSDANIDWSSSDETWIDWPVWTFTNFILKFLNFTTMLKNNH